MNAIERITNDSKDAVFKTSCLCSSDEHDLTIWIDKDEGFATEIFFNVIGPYPYSWCEDNPLITFWHRIKGALRILFTGRIVYQECFMFRDKEHVQDFVNALQEVILPD